MSPLPVGASRLWPIVTAKPCVSIVAPRELICDEPRPSIHTIELTPARSVPPSKLTAPLPDIATGAVVVSSPLLMPSPLRLSTPPTVKGPAAVQSDEPVIVSCPVELRTMAPDVPVNVVDPPLEYQTPFMLPALLRDEPLTTESPD